MASLFPVLAVERLNLQGPDTAGLQAADVDADPVRMGARHVERFDPAMAAESVLGDPRPEAVIGEVALAREQHETILRHDQVQEPGHATDRAVAVDDREVRRCAYRKAHATAVAAAFVHDIVAHGTSRFGGGSIARSA